MDGPIEKLVTRKRDIVDILSIVLVISISVVLMLIVFSLNFLTQVAPFIFAAALFFVTKFVNTRHIEFEYSYFNGDLEIDKIISKKKRKRVALVSVLDFELFGPQSAFDKVTDKPIEILFCSSLPDAIDNYNSKRMAFFFEPNEQIINDISKRAPRKLFKGE